MLIIHQEVKNQNRRRMSQGSDVMDTSKSGQFDSIKHMFDVDGAIQTRSRVNQCLNEFLHESCTAFFYFFSGYFSCLLIHIDSLHILSYITVD